MLCDSVMQVDTVLSLECVENSMPLQTNNPNTLFNIVEDKIVINLGDIQDANIDSNEIILSTLKLVFELCSCLGGITEKDEKQAKDVIEEILFKYRDRYKALANGRNVEDNC